MLTHAQVQKIPDFAVLACQLKLVDFSSGQVPEEKMNYNNNSWFLGFIHDKTVQWISISDVGVRTNVMAAPADASEHEVCIMPLVDPSAGTTMTLVPTPTSEILIHCTDLSWMKPRNQELLL